MHRATRRKRPKRQRNDSANSTAAKPFNHDVASVTRTNVTTRAMGTTNAIRPKNICLRGPASGRPQRFDEGQLGRKAFLLFGSGLPEITESAFIQGTVLQFDGDRRWPTRLGLDDGLHDSNLVRDFVDHDLAEKPFPGRHIFGLGHRFSRYCAPNPPIAPIGITILVDSSGEPVRVSLLFLPKFCYR